MKKISSHSHKKGFTLVELIITVGLFTIIITIAVGAFTSAIRTQRQVSSLISAQSNVSVALEQMTRDIRTGYLFCHASVAPSDPYSAHDIGSPPSDCNDTLSSDPSFELCGADVNGTDTWTCPALDFYDAEGDHVHYSLQNGALVESTNGAAVESITGDSVSVRYLQFVLHGQLEGDHWNPRITVSLGITPSSTDVGVESTTFNLETTVSARIIDCVPGTSSC